ncbi:MAG TPA: 7-cyano-7-deazaguanine synthase [Cytophagaceae bacterium]|jgi:7-cyano-7-deazaguanine synthase
MKKAILLSGGIDSTSVAYLHKAEISLAVTVDYGQKAALTEVEVSQRFCQLLSIQHEVIKVDCSSLGSGQMAPHLFMNFSEPVSEWWPFRNQLIITLAAIKLYQYKIETLLIGSVKSDKRFRDGSKIFFRTLSKCLALQEGGITLETPAIKMSSAQLVIESKIPDKLLLWTHSCHTSNNPCGNCNGCRKYFQVMKKLGIN